MVISLPTSKLYEKPFKIYELNMLELKTCIFEILWNKDFPIPDWYF